jgi:hypothetical protein
LSLAALGLALVWIVLALVTVFGFFQAAQELNQEQEQE